MIFLKLAFLLTVFFSSLLLFAVQPMFAKIILPNFGGGSAVWTACMLFFQTMLLAGYAYSYVLSKLFDVKFQAKIHGALVMVIALLMPYLLDRSLEWPAATFLQTTSPFLTVFSMLFISIGAPYFVLSATAPLIQHWSGTLVATTDTPDSSNKTYRLYSVSNIGAMLALFSYPFVVEIQFGLQQQTLLWSTLYWLFSAIILWSISTVVRNSSGPSTLQVQNRAQNKEPSQAQNHEQNQALSCAKSQTEKQSSSIITAVIWFLLSAAGVILLIATTSKMTQNIPPIPFLWILPLALYLLSFIITFHDEKYYVRTYWYSAFIIVSIMAVMLFFVSSSFGVYSQIALFLVSMFVGVMVCHGELYKAKPSPSQLTFFYLILSAGGCAGSVFASIVATELFTQHYEFIIGYAMVFILVAVSGLNQAVTSNQHSPKAFIASAASFVGVALFGLFFSFMNNQFTQFNIYESRNFYGNLAVKDLPMLDNPERRLVDGYTAHGAQSLASLNPAITRAGTEPASISNNRQADLTPLSYYRPASGIGLLLNPNYWQAPKKVGLVGLGVGALAYYGKDGDDFVFYELNPDVAHVANTYFDYLKRSDANLSIKLGDARMTLQHELSAITDQPHVAAMPVAIRDKFSKTSAKKFDVLVIDAFSSDAIPVHLLTSEAIELYQSHLGSNGVLAFHISNTYLDLKPVMRAISKQLQMTTWYFKTNADTQNEHMTEWVIFTNNKALLSKPSLRNDASVVLMEEGLTVKWNDDYSSLAPLLK
jgi:spermidine synthase